MNFKKFKHDVKKEKFIIPQMSDELKEYSKSIKYSYETKEKFSFVPIMKKTLVFVPIIVMLLCVVIISITNTNHPSYSLKTIQNGDDLQYILNYKRTDYDFDINGDDNLGIMGGVTEGVLPNPLPEDNPEDSQNKGDYSETNTQEKNVDEADIIKTDGNKIYYLNRAMSTLYVYNIQNKELNIIEKFNFVSKNKNIEMFLTSEYIIIIFENVVDENLTSQNLRINIYNKETYKLEHTYQNNGRYITSRLTNNTLYFVYSQINISNLPSDYDNGVYHEYDYSDINYSNISINKGYTFIVSVDLINIKFDVEILLGANYWTTVYCTQNNLYLALSERCYQFDIYSMTGSFYNSSKYQTIIYNYGLNKSEVEFNGIIVTDGRINNQFYLDEYDNHLRIVLNQGNRSNDELNKLEIYDLEEVVNGKIEKVASIDEGIGKERESIKSVRFEDNSCLIVTYVQTDPLYYIDLTNQLEPKIIGEYEEPGYNMYLHYINEELAIGFGTGTQGYKVGLYNLIGGVPNKISEIQGYSSLPVILNHKELYIENKIFGFSSTKFMIEEIDGYISNVKKNIYEVMEIDLTLETPQLKIKKIFEADIDDQYQRMVRVGDNNYLFSNKKLEILSNDYDVINTIFFE